MIDNMTRTPDVRHFYNRRWQDVPSIGGAKLERCIAILEAIRYLRLTKPNIIDLGCGTGWLTNVLSTFGPTIGVDISDVAIADASKRFPHVQFMCENIAEWDFPQSSFDLVVSHEVLEHFEDQQAYVRVVQRLLKPGGFLVMTTPNRWTSEALSAEELASYDRQPVENWLTGGELKTLLNRHMKVVSITSVTPGCGTRGIHGIVSSPLLREILKRLGVRWIFDGIALRAGFGLTLLAVARKSWE